MALRCISRAALSSARTLISWRDTITKGRRLRYIWALIYGTDVYDQLQNGVQLRILTLIDEFTKQSLAIEVRRSIRATDAIRVIE